MQTALANARTSLDVAVRQASLSRQHCAAITWRIMTLRRALYSFL